MELDQLRELIRTTPSGSGPDLDAAARGWLANYDFEIAAGDGAPMVLVVVALDEHAEFDVFALPAASVDDDMLRDLAAVSGAGFAFHFAADLQPDQFAGALRIFGGIAEEPDVFEEQLDEMAGELDGALDLDALRESAGGWLDHKLASGDALSGPVTHVFSATISM